jgi:truncated hemoglobin YjbI
MGITNRAIGGRAALDAAVERFHERVSADPELASQFEGLDMRRILARQMTLFGLVAAEPPRTRTPLASI